MADSHLKFLSRTFLFVSTLVFCAQSIAAQGARWPLWAHYKGEYIAHSGRVVDHSRADLRTTSEGQAYAMFFALVANDRQTFDRLLKWTRKYLAGGSLSHNLPAWLWGRGHGGQWGVEDANSASDADLWLAYDLLQAGRLWGVRRYAEEGHALLRLIGLHETLKPRNGPVLLLPGRFGFVHPPHITVNPSYLPPPILAAAATSDPRGPWKHLLKGLPEFFKQIAGKGAAPDWTVYTRDAGFSQTKKRPPVGGYDAIRTYLWAGLANQATVGVGKLRNILRAPARWLGTAHHLPEFFDTRSGNGHGRAPVGFYAAVLPLVCTQSSLACTRARQRLDKAISDALRRSGGLNDYYDFNLALFAEGNRSGRFEFGRNGDLIVNW